MSEWGVEYSVQRQVIPDGAWFHYVTCEDESDMYRVLAYEQSEERQRHADEGNRAKFRGVKKRIERTYTSG